MPVVIYQFSVATAQVHKESSFKIFQQIN
jgi:hypothetical protein